MKKIELFISHSSLDGDIVENFANLIANCFHVEDDRIKCSSSKRFPYTYGTNLPTEIMHDIKGATVIVFMTKNSKKSDWVLLELGIALGLTKQPIITAINTDDLEGLPSYMKTIFVSNISNREMVIKLIADIGKRTKWKLKNNEVVISEINNFYKKINLDKYKYPTEALMQRKDILLPKNNLRWNQIANSIQDHLIIIGWSCKNVFGDYSNRHFKTILKKGKKITIIIQSPKVVPKTTKDANEIPFLNFGPVCTFPNNKEIIKTIYEGKRLFSSFYKSLDKKYRKNIQLIETTYIITWSAVSIDMETENGVLQIEFYHYDDPVEDHVNARPNLILTRESEFYLGFKKSIQNIENSMKIE